MTPVFPRVDRDAVRPGFLGHQCCLNRIRIPGPPRLTEGGNVINIDAKQYSRIHGILPEGE